MGSKDLLGGWFISHTRPDIAFAVSVISQFMDSPKLEHWGSEYDSKVPTGNSEERTNIQNKKNKKIEIKTGSLQVEVQDIN